MNRKIQQLYLSQKSLKKTLSSLIFKKKQNQASSKIEQIYLGDEINFIKSKFNSQIINIEPNQNIFKILESPKNKYIAVFDTTQKVQSSFVTIYENPIYYDQLSSKFFLIKYYINPKSNYNTELIQFLYLISEYIYINRQAKFIVSLINSALVEFKYNWNKFNYLFFYEMQDETMTEYSSCEISQGNGYFANFHTENSQIQLCSMSQQKLIKSLSITRNTTERIKSLINISNTQCLNPYFDKIIHSIKIHNSFKQIFLINQKYPSRGIYYTRQHIQTSIQSINSKKSLNNLENLFLKINLNHVLENCKHMYVQTTESWFQEAKSMEFNLLKNKLNIAYEKIVQICNQEFQSYLNTQDFENNMKILKGWIMKKEEQIINLNDMLWQYQCSEYIHQNTFEFNLESIKQYFQSIKIEVINNQSLEEMIQNCYLSKIKQGLKKLKIQKNKEISRKVNYVQNKVQRLRNSEARMKIFIDKKINLQNWIDILLQENQNLQYFYCGLQLQNTKFEQTTTRLFLDQQKAFIRLSKTKSV